MEFIDFIYSYWVSLSNYPLIFLSQDQFMASDYLASGGIIRWDYGLTIGILGTITTWLFWKLDKQEKAYNETVSKIVAANKEVVKDKDKELKELNDKLLEAFVSVQTTLSIVGENNNTMMDKIEKTLEDHRKSLEKIVG